MSAPGSNQDHRWGSATRVLHLAQDKEQAATLPAHSRPTLLEARLAALEGGGHAYAFTSGQAAVAAVLDLLNAGAHVILSEGMRGARYRILEDMRRRTSGLLLSYVDVSDRQAIESAVGEDTKMIWVESPFSPTLRPVDLDAVAEIAKAHDLISVCDNTFLTPVFQRPLESGIDIVVHAASGYLFGGAPERAGAAVVAKDREFLTDKLGFQRAGVGTALLAPDQDPALGGLATLDLRMARACENAARLADLLAATSAIEAVHYPGQGGALSFLHADGLEGARGLLDRLELFHHREGPAALVSAIEHPALMHYPMVPAEIRDGMGLPDGLFRIWAGIEDGDDLVAAMKAALAA